MRTLSLLNHYASRPSRRLTVCTKTIEQGDNNVCTYRKSCGTTDQGYFPHQRLLGQARRGLPTAGSRHREPSPAGCFDYPGHGIRSVRWSLYEHHVLSFGIGRPLGAALHSQNRSAEHHDPGELPGPGRAWVSPASRRITAPPLSSIQILVRP